MVVLPAEVVRRRPPVVAQLNLGDHVTGHVPRPAGGLAPEEAVTVLLSVYLAGGGNNVKC